MDVRAYRAAHSTARATDRPASPPRSERATSSRSSPPHRSASKRQEARGKKPIAAALLRAHGVASALAREAGRGSAAVGEQRAARQHQQRRATTSRSLLTAYLRVLRRPQPAAAAAAAVVVLLPHPHPLTRPRPCAQAITMFTPRDVARQDKLNPASHDVCSSMTLTGSMIAYLVTSYVLARRRRALAQHPCSVQRERRS
ncbi:uncharacterized protein K452DRAFT_132058 [Aplosporella prunicola CBS 121167]|uniref:Uncharacterized protein n=1 Tax=Aplosporella prunicola CBS 121167 TaxID=1176127 RepID=A0A6A6BLB3_9PEZI|nr:uncharacterized protein K452DRAFT_132058 [Aplosporella prunicola CBS 121167]KAF2144912.1 hypothetical protein K452DRAFT_132058 [Aplosporella prunicola CBS 121167]